MALPRLRPRHPGAGPPPRRRRLPRRRRAPQRDSPEAGSGCQECTAECFNGDRWRFLDVLRGRSHNLECTGCVSGDYAVPARNVTRCLSCVPCPLLYHPVVFTCIADCSHKPSLHLGVKWHVAALSLQFRIRSRAPGLRGFPQLLHPYVYTMCVPPRVTPTEDARLSASERHARCEEHPGV